MSGALASDVDLAGAAMASAFARALARFGDAGAATAGDLIRQLERIGRADLGPVVADMRRLIKGVGLEARQRDNWYRLVDGQAAAA